MARKKPIRGFTSPGVVSTATRSTPLISSSTQQLRAPGAGSTATSGIELAAPTPSLQVGSITGGRGSTDVTTGSGQFGERLAEEKRLEREEAALSPQERKEKSARRRRLVGLGQEDPNLLRRVLFGGPSGLA